MKFQLSIVLLFLFVLQVLNAQNSTIDNIDDYLKDYKKSIPIPGFSVVIVENDRIVFSKGYGVEKAETNKPMTPGSSLAVGSVGRGFTALAIMQLVDEGLIELDEPVITYLPWFKTANKHFSDEITVRMCLDNSSGIPPIRNFSPDLDPSHTLEKFVRSMESSYIKRKPGSAHEFSDEGYSIAGLIISELSGMTYPEYLDNNVFRKLHMNRTTTDPRRFSELNVSYGHELTLDKCIPAVKEFVNAHFLPAGSELRTSANDLGHYLIALLNGGIYKGNRILSSKSVEELFKSNVSFRGLGTMLGGNGLNIEYALGWMGMVIEERKIQIHTGNTGTMASIIGLNREKNQGIAMLFNADVNRLNRYVYPTLENTANNVIHILNDEETTDFAVVRIDDPYDDDYTLPQEKWGVYLGHYSSFGKSHPLFKDMDIELLIGKSNQIELLAKKSGVVKGHYILQFINESRAALRSIAHPREIQFKLFPNGSIGGLYMFGTEFQKKGDLVEKRYDVQRDPERLVSFLFPKSAKIEWNNNLFKATFNNHPDTYLNLSIKESGDQSFEDFVKDVIQDDEIQTKGIIKNANVRDAIWTEQSVSLILNGKNYQLLLTQFEDPISGKIAQCVLRMPWGSFTSELQEVIMYIQRTITF